MDMQANLKNWYWPISEDAKAERNLEFLANLTIEELDWGRDATVSIYNI